MNISTILKRPILTEKSLQQASRSIFTFEVSRHATKDQIIAAVKGAFNVDVIKITTTLIPAKSYRSGRKRQEKLTQPSKKAQVFLKAGQKISLFDIEE